jgi:hypothetical protein
VGRHRNTAQIMVHTEQPAVVTGRQCCEAFLVFNKGIPIIRQAMGLFGESEYV